MLLPPLPGRKGSLARRPFQHVGELHRGSPSVWPSRQIVRRSRCAPTFRPLAQQKTRSLLLSVTVWKLRGALSQQGPTAYPAYLVATLFGLLEMDSTPQDSYGPICLHSLLVIFRSWLFPKTVQSSGGYQARLPSTRWWLLVSVECLTPVVRLWGPEFFSTMGVSGLCGERFVDRSRCPLPRTPTLDLPA
jgi:hypothetical protein